MWLRVTSLNSVDERVSEREEDEEREREREEREGGIKIKFCEKKKKKVKSSHKWSNAGTAGFVALEKVILVKLSLR